MFNVNFIIYAKLNNVAEDVTKETGKGKLKLASLGTETFVTFKVEVLGM